MRFSHEPPVKALRPTSALKFPALSLDLLVVEDLQALDDRFQLFV